MRQQRQKAATFETKIIPISEGQQVTQRIDEAPTHIGEVKVDEYLQDDTILYVELTKETSDKYTRDTNKTIYSEVMQCSESTVRKRRHNYPLWSGIHSQAEVIHAKARRHMQSLKYEGLSCGQ